MARSSEHFKISTREFWHNISHPTDSSLGKAILTLLVFAESLVCVFWIFTLSGLGEGYALMALVPYVYIIVSYTIFLILTITDDANFGYGLRLNVT